MNLDPYKLAGCLLALACLAGWALIIIAILGVKL